MNRRVDELQDVGVEALYIKSNRVEEFKVGCVVEDDTVEEMQSYWDLVAMMLDCKCTESTEHVEEYDERTNERLDPEVRKCRSRASSRSIGSPTIPR